MSHEATPSTASAGEPSDSPMLVTLAQLAEDTAEIMQELNEQNRAAVVTRHGRLIALIQPLVGRNVEGAAIAALLAEREAASGDAEPGPYELTAASDVQLG